jgi:hypothetical protein
VAGKFHFLRNIMMTTPSRKDSAANLGRIIPAENVRIVEAPQEILAAHQVPEKTTDEGSASRHEPEVTLVKDGDRVKKIIIKCTCGQVISLDCEY